jgi:hypothetical protein
MIPTPTTRETTTTIQAITIPAIAPLLSPALPPVFVRIRDVVVPVVGGLVLLAVGVPDRGIALISVVVGIGVLVLVIPMTEVRICELTLTAMVVALVVTVNVDVSGMVVVSVVGIVLVEATLP